MLDIIFQNSLVIILFTLGILVLIHELGHYLVGVLFNMGVARFSIGFGPKLCAFKLGETEFRIGAIPLGGYVQFVGATPHEEVPLAFAGKELYKKPIWQRSLMVIAGPVANLLLAGLVFSLIAFKGTQQYRAVVGVVEPNSAAEKAGLQPEDRILAIADQTVESWSDLRTITPEFAGKTVNAMIERSGKKQTVAITPAKADGKLGILLGLLPNSVSILPGSLASKAGLSSGTRITGVSIEPSADREPSADKEPSADREPSAHKEPSAGKKSSVTLGNSGGVLTQTTSWHSIIHYLEAAVLHNVHNEHRGDGDDGGKLILAFHLPRTPSSTPSSKNPWQLDSVPRGTELTASFHLEASHWQLLSQGHPDQMLASLGILSSQLMITGLKDATDSGDKTSKSRAEQQLQYGDTLTDVEDIKVQQIFDLMGALSHHRKSPSITVTVLRNGIATKALVEQTPHRYQTADGPTTDYLFPYQVGEDLIRPPSHLNRIKNPLRCLAAGFSDAFRYSGEILRSLSGLVIGSVPVKSLGGPILIAHVAKESAAGGLITYLTMLALISLNLFLINLIPIPVLDGGQLTLLGLEALKGRHLSRAFVEKYQAIGFVMILSLIILATYNDLSRYWLSMLESIGLE